MKRMLRDLMYILSLREAVEPSTVSTKTSWSMMLPERTRTDESVDQYPYSEPSWCSLFNDVELARVESIIVYVLDDAILKMIQRTPWPPLRSESCP